MINAERCMNLSHIVQEQVVASDLGEVDLSDRPLWPEEGEVVFESVSLKYRPTTEVVIDNLSF